MERLFEMHSRILDRQSETAFAAALSITQSEMEPVSADASNPQTKSRYASYVALDNALRPIYTKHGFALSYDTESPSPEVLRVFCYVSHKDGHTRTYKIDMPADGKGAKGGDVMTKTHATGSAATYGMRYLLKMIFNVAVGADDDDGNKASPTPERTITEAQVTRLRGVLDKCGQKVNEKFASDWPDPLVLPAGKYDAILNSLESAAIKHQAALIRQQKGTDE